MQSRLDQLQGVTFLYKSKEYIVKKCKTIGGKAIIETDRITFVKLPSEFDVFFNEIIFCEEKKAELAKENLDITNNIVIKNKVYNAEIINQNNLSSRLTEKLEAIFDELSNEPNEATFKKAKAMQEVANSIVGVQVTNFKYLTLNK